jgi:hypothetical protein
MIQYGLSKHPNAKWKEVKAEVITAEPAVSEVESTLIGPAWKLAMSKFSKLQVSYEQARSKVPTVEAELLENRAAPAAGVANTPQAFVLSINFVELLSKGPAEWSKLLAMGSKDPATLSKLLTSYSKPPVDDSKLLADLSKPLAQGSNDIVREQTSSKVEQRSSKNCC